MEIHLTLPIEDAVTFAAGVVSIRRHELLADKRTNAHDYKRIALMICRVTLEQIEVKRASITTRNRLVNIIADLEGRK